jgi:hypothetical protein
MPSRRGDNCNSGAEMGAGTSAGDG